MSDSLPVSARPEFVPLPPVGAQLSRSQLATALDTVETVAVLRAAVERARRQYSHPTAVSAAAPKGASRGQ